MSEESDIYVGLMSGTSLDGISAAVARFSGTSSIEHELLGFTHVPYAPKRRERLAAATLHGTAEEYCALGFELGEWLAEAALAAVAAAGLTTADVRAIGSHGQTLWHIPRRATWQIGETAVVAERTGVPVVGDFRARDVAAGGEGAPLVPIADALLYADPARERLLQNIGGIGNVTIVPPGGELARVRAFDTGPGVVVIDAVVRAAFPHLPYDVDGAIAAAGSIREEVLDELMADPYFAAPPPKSTGREYFGPSFSARLAGAVREAGGSPEDAVATATALTARSIAAAYRDHAAPGTGAEVVISGGGARNPTLVAMLRDLVAPRPVRLFDELYYDAEAKEGVAFALLAHLHLAGVPGNVTGATGARGPRILGKLTPA